MSAAETLLNNQCDAVLDRQQAPAGTAESLALPAADAAKLIGVSLSHFYQLHKTGRLPLPVRLGRSVRWLRSELSDWLAAGAPSRSRWQAVKGGGR